MESVQSRLQRVQEDFLGGEVSVATLREHVKDIFDAALAELYLDRDPLAKLIAKLHTVGVMTPLNIGPDELLIMKGDISQFSDGGQSSACTSCAQSFLQRLLSTGPRRISKEEINETVEDGKLNYALLYATSKNYAEISKITGEGEVPIYDCFSHFDSASTYELKNLPGALGEQTLGADFESSAQFFLGELERLDAYHSKYENVGFIVHTQGKTFALALVGNGDSKTYFLFDSHGCEAINRSKEAFVAASKKPAEMVRVLQSLCPFKRTERFVLGEDPIPEASAREMDRENNSYIAYPAVFGEIVEREVALIPVHTLEVLPIRSSEALLRERKVRVFAYLALMSMLATTYHYHKPLSHYVFSQTLPKDPPIPPPRVVPSVA
ncbi:hypothetical protein [Candidatus Neptunichlamydia sp. REUL1]|uniref:hypothetical protein n=1 Tax=Candidatus Neptunichlamydia sp. REUL1 TaxID=3064277 RepID=UPI00292CC716|nr:hypothetical protein [Candidatus Neptunochlamydia sp. REUL1]